MKKQVKIKWLAALNSGRYKQGKGALRQGRKFCCLGVLCDVYAKEKRKKWEKPFFRKKVKAILGEENFLPFEVVKWAGLEGDDPEANGKCLSFLNDKRMSFKEISLLIKKYL